MQGMSCPIAFPAVSPRARARWPKWRGHALIEALGALALLGLVLTQTLPLIPAWVQRATLAEGGPGLKPTGWRRAGRPTKRAPACACSPLPHAAHRQGLGVGTVAGKRWSRATASC